jgi:hypothetical protein
LNLLGVKVGPVRLPLSVGGELTYEEREELREREEAQWDEDDIFFYEPFSNKADSLVE